MGILEKRAEVLYTKFRQELDQKWIPEVLKRVDIIPIGKDAKIGMMCVADQTPFFVYIDCLYIRPEHRRKGYARKAVLEWYEKQTAVVRLHIINTNEPALRFWNKLFELEVIEENDIDTLYCIKKVK